MERTAGGDGHSDRISFRPVIPHKKAKQMARAYRPRRTLAIDVGGSGIKMVVLDAKDKPLTERARVDTPHPATPRAVLRAIIGLAMQQGRFDRVSVGFPGVVRSGVTETAHNLHPSWIGFDLDKALTKALRRPTRVSNDADVQGFGVIRGRGVELVVTLGTGVGSALFVDGKLARNLELGHHPFLNGKTYEEELGLAALKKHGKRKWNKHLERAIELLDKTFNYDVLYLGGGDARKIDLDLPPNVKVVSNFAGLLGGMALWSDGFHEPRRAKQRQRR